MILFSKMNFELARWRAPFCLPVCIAECSFVKFANKFPESLLGADSVHFSLICLLFRAKCITEIHWTLVKTRHFFCEGFTQLTNSLLLPGRTNLAGKLPLLVMWLVRAKVTWYDIHISYLEHFCTFRGGENVSSPGTNKHLPSFYFTSCVKFELCKSLF